MNPKPNDSIKVVVFDLGKVLLDFDYSIAISRIAARGKLAAEQITAHMQRSPILLRYEAGLVTSQEFFAEVCTVTGYGGDIEEFAGCFGDIFTPVQAMIEMQQALRNRGLPTYIFSNTNDFAVRYIRKTFPFFANFDGYILSYEHGCMKPDAALYSVVERECGQSGPGILYFDDRPENITAGAERGWRAFLHESPEQTTALVKNLGLL